MAFSKTTLSEVKEKFGLSDNTLPIFPNISPILPSELLKSILETNLEQPMLTEKAKSELVVSPILLEVWRICNKQFTIFSGATLSIKSEKKMVGECDFIFTATPKNKEIEAPIFTLVEAKNDNIPNAYGQCVMQMYAAQLFNKEKGKEREIIWGCVTNGREWEFLYLKGREIVFHNQPFYLNELQNILGVFKFIVDSSIKN